MSDTIDNLPVLPERIADWRPTKSSYDPAMFEQICQAIEAGKSLSKACREAGVPKANMYYWAECSQQCADRLAYAQAQQADSIFERIMDGATDLQSVDYWIGLLKERGVEAKALNSLVNAVERGLRLELDICKRLNPEKYGDRIENINRNLTMLYVVSFGDKQQVSVKDDVVDCT